MKTVRRITSKDLDELGKFRPLLVDHYRHIKTLIGKEYLKYGESGAHSLSIYRSTRREIEDLILLMRSGKLDLPFKPKGGD